MLSIFISFVLGAILMAIFKAMLVNLLKVAVAKLAIAIAKI